MHDMKNRTPSYPFLQALVLIKIIFLLANDTWFASAGLVSPPSVISLIEPLNTGGIQLGTSVPVGMSIPPSQKYFGLLYAVQINVTYPNGTTGPVIDFASFPISAESSPVPGSCTPSLSGTTSTGDIFADQIGTLVMEGILSFHYILTDLAVTQSNITFLTIYHLIHPKLTVPTVVHHRSRIKRGS